MKSITVSEFRKNIKKYAELASKEKVIVNRGDGKAFFIVPVNKVEDDGYNSEFVEKILKSKAEFSGGEFIEVKDVNNLWASLE